MFLSSLSVHRPVFTTMLVVAFVVLGLFGYLNLAVDLMPNVEFPFVTITTIYPGAGPEEIESQITTRIEDAVSTISDIDLMESISRESVSLVLIRFKLEAGADAKANDTRAKVDAILNELPEGAQKPQVMKFEMGARPIISLAVSSPRGVNTTYAVADRLIRDRLSQVPGVATVDILGGQKREIQVAVDRRKLDHYGLPISAVTQAIALENVNIPQGRIVGREEEYTLRTVGQFTGVEEIGAIPIALPSGGFLPLRDLAEVRDAFEEARSLSRFNGLPAVQVDVVKQPGGNTIATADGINRAVDALRRELPDDFTLEYANDDSIFIRDTVKDLQGNILIGILLTAAMLYLFLRNLRITIVAMVVMPAAIVSAFLLVQASGFTLNVMSLMALGISVGLLVTNAIVVLESIMRNLRLGLDAKQAAIRGTDEVALAVLASVMTNLVVFLPVAFMKGIIGRFFLQFGLTVVFATLFSLLISFTLTPMLASIVLRAVARRRERRAAAGDPARIAGALPAGPAGGAGGPDAFAGAQGDGNAAPAGERLTWMDRLMGGLARRYRGALAWSIARPRNRFLVLAATTLFFAFGVLLMGISGGEFMPRIDQGFVNVSVKLPAGSSLARTTRTIEQVEEILRAEPAVRTILSTIGGGQSGVHEAMVMAKLVPLAERGMSAYAFSNRLRPKLAGIPGAEVSVSAEEGRGGAAADVEIEVMGDETGPLRELADRVLEIAASVPGLVDVNPSYEPGGRELAFLPDREEIARQGLSTGLVAMLLRNAFEGDAQSVYREGGEEYAIRVQFADEDRRDASTLRALRLPVGPARLPLSQLGAIEERRGEAEILRRERQRRITISANIGQGTLSEVVSSIRARTDRLELPPGYRIKFAGTYEFQQEAFASLMQALLLAIILTYVVLAMSLESFIDPVTVMITLPLGLIGAAIGLFLGGQTVNIISIMALIMLVGIVVNNAILLLDYVAQLRRRGLPLREALLEACPVRLRPIIMTNLAIAVGMVPQVLGKGAGFEYRTAIGFVTMGGVLVSALFTLVLIPTLYTWAEEILARVRSRREG